MPDPVITLVQQSMPGLAPAEAVIAANGAILPGVPVPPWADRYSVTITVVDEGGFSILGGNGALAFPTLPNGRAFSFGVSNSVTLTGDFNFPGPTQLPRVSVFRGGFIPSTASVPYQGLVNGVYTYSVRIVLSRRQVRAIGDGYTGLRDAYIINRELDFQTLKRVQMQKK